MDTELEEQWFSHLHERFWMVRAAKNRSPFIINTDVDCASVCSVMWSFPFYYNEFLQLHILCLVVGSLSYHSYIMIHFNLQWKWMQILTSILCVDSEPRLVGKPVCARKVFSLYSPCHKHLWVETLSSQTDLFCNGHFWTRGFLGGTYFILMGLLWGPGQII